MGGLEKFKLDHGLSDQAFLLIPYGSRVYGTASDKSDYDYSVVLLEDVGFSTGEEFLYDDVNIHVYTKDDWQKHLNEHKIHTLEAWYLQDSPCRQKFEFNLNLSMLRHSFSEKASHSFVKAKKKITVERDFIRGWKSLFHSLRILNFGIQIATNNEIKFDAANKYWFDILKAQQYNWKSLEDKYKPIHNKLASHFRTVASK